MGVCRRCKLYVWTGQGVNEGRRRRRTKDIQRYADMEPVIANTVQTVWTVFKAVELLGAIATPRAHALAASAASYDPTFATILFSYRCTMEIFVLPDGKMLCLSGMRRGKLMLRICVK